MSEVYTKPSVAADHLSWGTTITGSISEWDATKRVGGFYNGEPVPAEKLNFRWNLLGEWIQFTSAPVQRRFTSLSDGVATTLPDEVFWVDVGTGYLEHWEEKYLTTSAYADDGTISDVNCDSEYLFYSIGENVSSVDPDTGSENTDYLYEIGSDVTSIYSDGQSAYCTVSGSTFYRLDREDSDVSKVSITVPSAKEVTGFKSNGYYGMGFLNGTSQYVPLYRNLNTTPVYITDIDASYGVNDVALSDTVGFCACNHGPSLKVNIRSFSLSGGVAGWTGEAGSGFYDGYSVCTDGARVYLVHERSTYNVTCYSVDTGDELWTADAYLSGYQTATKTFLDDKYVYVSSNEKGSSYNVLFIFDKNTGYLVKRILTGAHVFYDSDAWQFYGFSANLDLVSIYGIGGTPKQFYHTIGSKYQRRPFFKLGLPLGN